MNQASVKIKNSLCDIQDKLRDIKKLEVAVNQYLQFFAQLSAITFAQGEKIDNIEANVAQGK